MSLVQKISDMKMVKKTLGLLKVSDLLIVMNSYDKSITLKNVWLLVSFFGFPIKKDDSVKYEELRTDYKNFMDKFQLRKPRVIEEFFMETPGHLNKPSPANSNQSTPMASKADLRLPGEIKVQSYLSSLRQKLKLLNEEDAKEFFVRADSNRSGTMSKDEFLEYVKNKLPEVSKESALEMFRVLDKKGKGMVDQPEFIATMIKEVELVNRIELLTEKTAWAHSLFQKINEYLGANPGTSTRRSCCLWRSSASRCDQSTSTTCWRASS